MPSPWLQTRQELPVRGAGVRSHGSAGALGDLVPSGLPVLLGPPHQLLWTPAPTNQCPCCSWLTGTLGSLSPEEAGPWQEMQLSTEGWNKPHPLLYSAPAENTLKPGSQSLQRFIWASDSEEASPTNPLWTDMTQRWQACARQGEDRMAGGPSERPGLSVPCRD